LELLSRRIQLDNFMEAVEYYYQQGWTDGLPVIPPTLEKVEEMLRAVDVAPAQIIGELKERNSIFTAEKIAINAVMAGCLPSYMPVIVSAVRAICEPSFLLHGVTASTGGAGILMIINGPIVKQLNIAAGQNYFSGTNRANVTIARAIRLLLLNVGSNRIFDRTTMGHGGKVMCVAEQENSFWEPLHVERGFQSNDNTVTIFAAEGPNQIQHHFATKPEQILQTFADRMSALGTFNIIKDSECVLVICPEHFHTFKKWGWSKKNIQEYLFSHARRPMSDLVKTGLLAEEAIEHIDIECEATIVSDPAHILVIAGGGEAGPFSAFLPGWGSRAQSRALTRKIDASGCADGG
jgi:hypothetical protein